MKTVRWCLRISCVIQFVSLIVFIVLSISSDTQYHECIDRRGDFRTRNGSLQITDYHALFME